MTTAVPARSEVAPEHTWDTASVFPSDEAWQQELESISDELPSFDRFRDQLGHDPATLADYLESADGLMQRVGRVFLYASMQHSVDTADQAATARYDQAIGLYTRARAAIAFAEPELLRLDSGRLHEWTQRMPRLAVYDHYFDTIRRRRAHVRSGEIEELLSQVQDPFYTANRIHGTFADADLRFRPAESSDGETIEISQGNINQLLSHPDREVRRTAWTHYADAHLAAKNTLASCLATGVKQHVFVARARRYQSSLQAALEPNNIPIEVFHNLIETYRRHLPTWHRYWRVRREALGYDQFQPYDIKAPLTEDKPIVSFDRAVEWICAGMQPLGDEYVATMRRGLDEQRWVDRYPNQGKRMGAFSTGVPGTHPFILMSYADDLYAMSTLAHELGHSMHSYLTWQNQPLVYGDYSLFVAEVASNFNQALVRDHLLREHNDADFQIAVIEEAMANFHRYFFIMPTLARFELEIHERVERGEGLTADRLIRLMADLFREGYGDEVAFDAERIGSTWMQFSTHMYANFYVYQYATGISAAHALAEGVLHGRPNAAEQYLKFLKAGGSLYPLDALRLAGVDMAAPAPVEQTFAVLARYVDRLEELLNQRAAMPNA
jgi:oligoendopeptidase F